MDETNPSKLFSVEGMVVLVTGGATGIGLMMTKAFANNGAAKVYIVGRRKEKLDEAARLHPSIIPVVGDVTSKESLLQVAEQVRKEVGYLNLLCCNSGYMPPRIGLNTSEVSLQEFAQKALEQKPEDWATTFSTNSTSVFFSTMVFLELLDAGNKKANAPGRKSQVIVTTSIASYLRVPVHLSVYGISKTAATHLVKHLASTLTPYDIRVNAICPGLFPSDLAADVIASGGQTKLAPTEEGAYQRSFIPAQRLGRTEDMAATLLYMASNAGAYMNGNIQVLDGGRMSILPGTY